ncbi:hypothetical protein Tco_1184894 [Tanacetum coccineum]
MSMPVQMSQAQDSERPQVDDQILYLADDLKEAQDHIPHSITSHMTKITTSREVWMVGLSKTMVVLESDDDKEKTVGVVSEEGWMKS